MPARRPLVPALFALLLVQSLACGSCSGVRDDLLEDSLRHEDRQRSFFLYLPPELKRGSPLVVMLHGGGGRAGRMAAFTGFHEVAEREGFALLFPQGVGKSWNDGREDGKSISRRENIDDVGFLTTLIEKTLRDHKLDPRRVYISGISNGGLMTMRMVCERAYLFAAAAPVVAGMSEEIASSCEPGEPVALAVIQGTEDPLVPYGAGQVARDRGLKISTEALLAFGRKNNGCAEAVSERRVIDADPEDETRGELRIWRDGCEDAPVRLYHMEGMGHVWPGGVQYMPKAIIGPATMDMDASEELWRFFATQRRERAASAPRASTPQGSTPKDAEDAEDAESVESE